ncbi:tRNA-intron lyase [Halonotius terrestris]|uniref:tRNA-splicing endonuclease n=1 Tax=Halonotius terrestris TaxID=2487750 RepID=A0A8J8PBU0_9EURY|nr:tRNA-intron lyase [Halonotius terrestris]TQQ83842.1 tRNA-intron lyase [Halonotius terrestris]
MDGHLRNGVVEVGGNARQQFHDARGYGTPTDGNEIRLSRVEAAHLLLRGDLAAVVDHNGETDSHDATDGDDGRLSFAEFFVTSAAAAERFALRFLVYADLRDRGFYLSPARAGWPGGDGGDAVDDGLIDLLVPPRGTKPGDGEPAYRIAVVGERESIPASELAGVTLAVVDEESEISYLETATPDFDGGTTYSPPEGITGSLIGDRVVVWDAPDGFYEHGFYGQPLEVREAIIDSAVQLSLVEAAALAAEGQLVLEDVDDDAAETTTLTATEVAGDMMPQSPASYTAIREQGRAVEGERFDRRLAVYRTLRDQQVVPKTGYKFGADFRTYDTVESVEDLPHSERLVRVVEADHAFDPRELSLDVRLAGGVGKRMVFALTGANGEIDWLSVSRLTP